MTPQRYTMLALTLIVGSCTARQIPEGDARATDQSAKRPPTKLDLLVVVSLGEDGREFSTGAQRALGQLMRQLLAPDDSRPIRDLHLGVVTSKINHTTAKMPPECNYITPQTKHRQDGYLVQPSVAGGIWIAPPEYVGWPPGWDWPPSWSYITSNEALTVDVTALVGFYLQSAAYSAPFCNITEFLEVVKLATDGRNAGFLRPDSLLAIVLLANWEDCSTDDVSQWDPDIWSSTIRYSNNRCYEPPLNLLYTLERYEKYLSQFHPLGQLLFGIIGAETKPEWETVTGSQLAVKPICSLPGVHSVAPTLRIPELMRRLQNQRVLTAADAVMMDPCALYQNNDSLMQPVARRILQVVER